jgi:hypothetical protein
LVLSDRISLVGISCVLGAMNLVAAGCAMLLPEALHGMFSRTWSQRNFFCMVTSIPWLYLFISQAI